MMLKFVDVPPRAYFSRVLAATVFIALFISAILMLRSPQWIWYAFFCTLAQSLVYSIVCGMLAFASIYQGERWCCKLNPHAKPLVVLGLCIASGLMGEFVGTAIILGFAIPGAPPAVAGASLMSRVLASWVYAPTMALITSFFSLVIYGFDMLLRNLRTTAGKLKEKELQEERLLKLKAEAELKALQARIDPHFLFNTLNSIASLIADEPRKAEEMTEKLSALFRYTLSANRENRVTLEQELHIVRSYLDIEQLRLGARLKAAIECEDGLQQIPIPPLLLQPLVENSVKYAVAGREQGGEIHVRVKRRDGRCLLEVVDDGPGFTSKLGGSGMAIENIRQRLAALYNGDQSFSILRADGRTVIRIEVPIAV